MPRLIVTTREGALHALDATVGFSVMETIRDNGISELLALCGGVCACATCHVHVAPEYFDMLPPMSEDEDELLESSAHRTALSRLGCQVRLTEALSGLQVTIAAED